MFIVKIPSRPWVVSGDQGYEHFWKSNSPERLAFFSFSFKETDG
jgi:hypothetical protein